MSTSSLTHRRHLRSLGIASMAEVPPDRGSKVLHLCRFPARCCTVCERHKDRCRHERSHRTLFSAVAGRFRPA